MICIYEGEIILLEENAVLWYSDLTIYTRELMRKIKGLKHRAGKNKSDKT